MQYCHQFLRPGGHLEIGASQQELLSSMMMPQVRKWAATCGEDRTPHFPTQALYLIVITIRTGSCASTW